MSYVLLISIVVLVLWLALRWWAGFRSMRQLAEVREALRANAILLDVRTRGEYQHAHLPGALHIPQHTLMQAETCLREKSAPIVVYCATGIRSRSAVEMLRHLGFSRVYDLGKMSNFERLKLPFYGRSAPHCDVSR